MRTTRAVAPGLGRVLTVRCPGRTHGVCQTARRTAVAAAQVILVAHRGGRDLTLALSPGRFALTPEGLLRALDKFRNAAIAGWLMDGALLAARPDEIVITCIHSEWCRAIADDLLELAYTNATAEEAGR